MCPPGADQTERGPQRWHILAPRSRKIQRLAPPDHSIYGTLDPQQYLFNNNNSWNSWSKLALRVAPHQTPTPAVRRSLPSSERRTSPLSKLESLPSELLALVIEDSTLTKSDVIALGLASETLWGHVLRHVEKDCWLAAPSMAGVEIACTGSYLLDLPPSFAQGDLAKSSVVIWDGGFMCEARKINWAATSSYDAVQETPEEAWRAVWMEQDGHLACFPPGAARKMSADFAANCSALRGASPDALWVLRNLTTREYVRCRPGEGPLERRGFVDCKDGTVKVRVDDVLLLRICWTKVEAWDDMEELGIFRGEWAGHCFDIVPWERLDGDKGWRDCTDEVLEQARDVEEKMSATRVKNASWLGKRNAKVSRVQRLKHVLPRWSSS